MQVQSVQRHDYQQSFGKLTKVKFYKGFPKPEKSEYTLDLLRALNESGAFKSFCNRFDEVRLYFSMVKQSKDLFGLFNDYTASLNIEYRNNSNIRFDRKIRKALGFDVFNKDCGLKEISGKTFELLEGNAIKSLKEKLIKEKFDYRDPIEESQIIEIQNKIRKAQEKEEKEIETAFRKKREEEWKQINSQLRGEN